MAREFTTVGVVGLGTMGAGIVEVFAREGLQVIGVEPTEESLERGRGHLQNSTDWHLRRPPGLSQPAPSFDTEHVLDTPREEGSTR